MLPISLAPCVFGSALSGHGHLNGAAVRGTGAGGLFCVLRFAGGPGVHDPWLLVRPKYDCSPSNSQSLTFGGKDCGEHTHVALHGEDGDNIFGQLARDDHLHSAGAVQYSDSAHSHRLFSTGLLQPGKSVQDPAQTGLDGVHRRYGFIHPYCRRGCLYWDCLGMGRGPFAAASRLLAQNRLPLLSGGAAVDLLEVVQRQGR